jgi:hypothetical protein
MMSSPRENIIASVISQSASESDELALVSVHIVGKVT